MKPNRHTASTLANTVIPNVGNDSTASLIVTISASRATRGARSAARTASRLVLALAAVGLLLTASAFAEDSPLPSFIKVGKKYSFAVGVDTTLSNAKQTTWQYIEATVTEMEKTGWVTITSEFGVRHLNLRQVLFVIEVQ